MSLDFKNIQTKTFVDIPSSEPRVRIPLPRVGISNRPAVFKLKNPLNAEIMGMPSNLRVAASLPATQRGIHMSRIEECMDELKESGLSPADFSMQLARLILKTQNQTSCIVEIDSTIENRVNKNKSGKASTEIIKFHSYAEIKDGTENLKVGVTVPFMNACPCTQRWAMRDFYNLLSQKGLDEEKVQELVKHAPLQAHTNGGEATLFLSGSDLCHADIYKVLESSVPIIREMLKGIDEHTFVRMTHEQGQFCEDNIRAIAQKTVEILTDKVAPTAIVSIKVEVNESVHFHNLWAEMEKSFSDLSDEINQAL